MFTGVGAGFGIVAGMAAVSFDVAVLDTAETISAIDSEGSARTGVTAGVAPICDAVGGAGTHFLLEMAR